MTKRRYSIIAEVAVLFLLGILLSGILTLVAIRYFTDRSVEEQVVTIADNIANESLQALTEYPGSEFLFQYWYEHAGELELDYDATYNDGHKTQLQCQIWNKRNPEFPLDYVTSAQIRSMPEEDQRLYAEILYSWINTRLDQIKAASNCEFLYVAATDDSYKNQFFLLSAAKPGEERGREYGQVYPLGTYVEVDEGLEDAMRQATENDRYLVDAGLYKDYYTYVDRFDDKTVLIGITYSQETIERNKIRETLIQSFSSLVFQLLLATTCLLLLFLAVIRPLKMVQQDIRLYKETKDSRAVIEDLDNIRLRNEIGELARDVQELAVEVDDYVDKIESFTAENERISTELNLASRIQLAMLPMIFPPFPEHKELDIYATMIPAKEVGGDFYDFFMVDDTHLGLVMADVSGKGVPAALFMTITKVLLQNELNSGKTPAQVLEKINDRICRNNTEEMFVTVWLGCLDLKTGELTAANAGHEYPIVKKPNGHFELIKDKHGFVVGGMAGMKYTDYTIQMDPGSKIFLYTDGVPEAERKDREQFGIQRTLTMLRLFENLTPQEIITGMSTAVYDHVGDIPQFDDITMLCIHYKGMPEEPAEEK